MELIEHVELLVAATKAKPSYQLARAFASATPFCSAQPDKARNGL